MTRRLPAGFRAALALLALGCGSPAPSAVEAPASPQLATRLPIAGTPQRAETLGWRMEVRGVEVARFEQHLTPVGNVVRVISVGRLSGVARFFRVFDASAAVIIDGVTGRTRSALIDLRAQGEYQRVTQRYVGSRVRGTRGDKGESTAFERRSISDLAPISSETFLLSLRHWRGDRGERALAVVMGVENMWLVELEAGDVRVHAGPLGERRARELVGTARRLDELGEIEALASSRSVRVLVSDDDERLPLSVQTSIDGSAVTISLTEYRAR